MNNRRIWLFTFGAIVLGASVWFGKPVWQTPSSTGDAATASNGQPRVMLFGTDWCPYCAQTRVFFKSNGIQFADLDVEKSSEAGEQFRQLRGKGVPVIVIGDHVYRGFDEEVLRNVLGPWLKYRDPPRNAPDSRVELDAGRKVAFGG